MKFKNYENFLCTYRKNKQEEIMKSNERFGKWLYLDEGKVTKNQVISYLKEYLGKADFYDIHTRKQLCKMLNILYPHHEKNHAPFGGILIVLQIKPIQKVVRKGL